MVRARASASRGVALGLTVAGAIAAVGATRLVLGQQAALARRRIGKPLGEDAIDADRVWRRRLDGAPLDLLLLGDSLAAGLGAGRRKDTLGDRVAKAAARRLPRAGGGGTM